MKKKRVKKISSIIMSAFIVFLMSFSTVATLKAAMDARPKTVAEVVKKEELDVDVNIISPDDLKNIAPGDQANFKIITKNNSDKELSVEHLYEIKGIDEESLVTLEELEVEDDNKVKANGEHVVNLTVSLSDKISNGHQNGDLVLTVTTNLKDLDGGIVKPPIDQEIPLVPLEPSNPPGNSNSNGNGNNNGNNNSGGNNNGSNSGNNDKDTNEGVEGSATGTAEMVKNALPAVAVMSMGIFLILVFTRKKEENN